MTKVGSNNSNEQMIYLHFSVVVLLSRIPFNRKAMIVITAHRKITALNFLTNYTSYVKSGKIECTCFNNNKKKTNRYYRRK